MIDIFPYEEAKRQEWEDFVLNSKNGTFHQTRKFLDYHGDRFVDASLMINYKGKLTACIPAAKIDGNFFAHPGLTYGGIIIGEELYLSDYMEIFKELLHHLKREGFTQLTAKDIPSCYCSAPSGELTYAMLSHGASLRSFDVLPLISPGVDIPLQNRRKRAIKKAEKAEIKCHKSDDLDTFWDLLETVLAAHDATPVHSRKEIHELSENFPDNIFLEAAFEANEMVAGVLLFRGKHAERAQYIAVHPDSRNGGSLDLLFQHIIEDAAQSNLHVEFGTTTLDGGKVLSTGLSDQKEGFGARSLIQYSYQLDFANLPPNPPA